MGSTKGSAVAGPADDLREWREARGWTHEQVADVLGLLPVEVSAWESGAVPLLPNERQWIRWYVDSQEYERLLAERSACEWLPRQQRRLDDLARRGARRAAWVSRYIARHRAGCEHCQAAMRQLPPPPPQPLVPGMRGRIARLPAWLRVPLEAAELGGWFTVACMPFVALTLLVSPDEIPHFLQMSLWLGPAAAWILFTHRLLRPLGDRLPFLAGQVQAALVFVPAILLWGGTESAGLQDPWLWVLACIFGGLTGLLMGAKYDPDSDDIG